MIIAWTRKDLLNKKKPRDHQSRADVALCDVKDQGSYSAVFLPSLNTMSWFKMAAPSPAIM
jgi:hypothetical protein